MTDDPKGPVKAPKERTQEDSQNENINPLMPGKEVRELLSEDHSMLSVESLQDNYERIPKAFKEEVIDYLSGAIKEHGENSLFGKKIKNFLQSILPKGKSEKGPTRSMAFWEGYPNIHKLYPTHSCKIYRPRIPPNTVD